MGKGGLPVQAMRELFANVSAAGAVHVKELTVADWQSFPSWSKLGRWKPVACYALPLLEAHVR